MRVCVRAHAHTCSVLSNSFLTLRTAAHQAPLSMGFSRQEHWSGLTFPPPGDPPDPGIEPASTALAGRLFTPVPPGKPRLTRPSLQMRYCSNRPKGATGPEEFLSFQDGRPISSSETKIPLAFPTVPPPQGGDKGTRPPGRQQTPSARAGLSHSPSWVFGFHDVTPGNRPSADAGAVLTRFYPEACTPAKPRSVLPTGTLLPRPQGHSTTAP